MRPQPPTTTLTSRELATQAGITYRQLDYWARAGYLRTLNEPSGSGFRRAWPLEEVAVAVALRQVVARGVPARVVARIAAEVRRGALEGTVLLDADGVPTALLAEAVWVVQLGGGRVAVAA